MTILRVHENAGIKGGSEVYIRDVSAELERRGIRNILLFIERKGLEYEIYLGRQLDRVVPLNKLRENLEAILGNYQADIVHIHGISDKDIISFFISRYKVIRTMHEPRMVCPGYSKFWVVDGKPCTRKYGLHCFYHAYTQQCFRSRKPINVLNAYLNTEFEVKEASEKYYAILTMSEYIRNEAIIAGIRPEKVICNPHFTKFDLPFLPFEGTKKHFLFVGRLVKHKGIFELLEAMQPVLQTNRDVCLDIVGDGPLYKTVSDFIIKHQLEDQVTLEKWKSSEEISSLMKRAYCVLFPSIYPEAFGLVGIEAAMHSRPVIAFNSGGVSTWLTDNFNGYLLNDISAAALRKSVERILEDRAHHAVMSQNAYQYALSYFSPARHVDKLVSIYDSCILSL